MLKKDGGRSEKGEKSWEGKPAGSHRFCLRAVNGRKFHDGHYYR